MFSPFGLLTEPCLDNFLKKSLALPRRSLRARDKQARALYKLSELQTKRGMQTESMACKDRALKLRAKLKPELADAPFQEAEFSKLCLWMLW
jgi:hypothetical protein